MMVFKTAEKSRHTGIEPPLPSWFCQRLLTSKDNVLYPDLKPNWNADICFLQHPLYLLICQTEDWKLDGNYPGMVPLKREQTSIPFKMERQSYPSNKIIALLFLRLSWQPRMGQELTNGLGTLTVWRILSTSSRVTESSSINGCKFNIGIQNKAKAIWEHFNLLNTYCRYQSNHFRGWRKET